MDGKQAHKAYIGDQEFNVADLAELTMAVLDSLMAVTKMLSPDAADVIRDQLLKRSEAKAADGSPGSSALLKEAALRFSASRSSEQSSPND